MINKIDLLDERQLSLLREALAAEFPQAEIVEIAARESRNLKDWFDQITSPSSKLAIRWKLTTMFTRRASRCSAG